MCILIRNALSSLKFVSRLSLVQLWFRSPRLICGRVVVNHQRLMLLEMSNVQGRKGNYCIQPIYQSVRLCFSKLLGKLWSSK